MRIGLLPDWLIMFNTQEAINHIRSETSHESKLGELTTAGHCPRGLMARINLDLSTTISRRPPKDHSLDMATGANKNLIVLH